MTEDNLVARGAARVSAPTIRPEQAIFTPAEAAVYLRCSRDLVYELCASGALRSFKIGRSRRIGRDALLEFVESCEAAS